MYIRLTLDFQTGCHFKESWTDLVEECHCAVTIGILTEWSTLDASPYVREEAGTHRYNVGTDTPKLCTTSCGVVPLANSFLAA
jgi:hypothetical protein